MAENCEKKSDKRLANLLPGGVPGNKGGGRPKSEIRNRCAIAFDDHIETLRKAAMNEDGTFSRSDQLKAIDLLGKYGGLQQTDITTNDQPINPTYHESLDNFTPEQLKALEAILGGSTASPHSEDAQGD